MTQLADNGGPITGKWFEEFVPGDIIRHGVTHTIIQEENVEFSRMTRNPALLHLDRDYAASTEFGKPLFNSMFTLALVVGISVGDMTTGTTVANLGFKEVVFPAPLFEGDTIRVETEILSVRESRSRPNQGIVTFEHRAFVRDDTLVCRAIRSALMHKRPA